MATVASFFALKSSVSALATFFSATFERFLQLFLRALRVELERVRGRSHQDLLADGELFPNFQLKVLLRLTHIVPRGPWNG